jgi:hypothetical protein
MTTQKTVQISDQWQSLNTLSGATVGAKIDSQVLAGRDVRVAVGDAAPGLDTHGFRFSPGKFFRSEAGSPEVWVRAEVDGDNAKLEVEY